MSQTATRQAELIDALLNPSHRSIESAAAAAGVARRTVYRWLADPAFRAKLDDAQGEELDGVARRTVSALGHCEAVYLSMMADKSKPDAIRLRAAQLLADLALRLWEVRGIERRLSDMEAMLLER